MGAATSRLRLLAIVFAVAGPALAADPADPMQRFYGNTLECRSEQLRCHIWFAPDGSYLRFDASLDAKGAPQVEGMEGRYRVTAKERGQEVCLMARSVGGPMGNRPVECIAFVAPQPGDRWEAKLADGRSLSLVLHAGRRVNGGVDFLY